VGAAMLESDIGEEMGFPSTSRFQRKFQMALCSAISERDPFPRHAMSPEDIQPRLKLAEIDMGSAIGKLIRDKTIGKTDLTVTDLSKKLDIGRPALSNVLNGSASLSIESCPDTRRNLRFECKTTAD